MFTDPSSIQLSKTYIYIVSQTFVTLDQLTKNKKPYITNKVIKLSLRAKRNKVTKTIKYK